MARTSFRIVFRGKDYNIEQLSKKATSSYNLSYGNEQIHFNILDEINVDLFDCPNITKATSLIVFEDEHQKYCWKLADRASEVITEIGKGNGLQFNYTASGGNPGVFSLNIVCSKTDDISLDVSKAWDYFITFHSKYGCPSYANADIFSIVVFLIIICVQIQREADFMGPPIFGINSKIVSGCDVADTGSGVSFWIRWGVISLSILMSSIGQYLVDVLSVMQSDLMENLEIEQLQYSLLFTTNNFSNALFTLVGGILVDTFAPRVVVISSTAVILLSQILTLIGSLTGKYWVLLVSRIFLGIGFGAFTVGKNTFPPFFFNGKESQSASAVTMTFLRLVSFLHFLLSPTLVSSVGYKAVLNAGVVMAFIMLVAAVLYGFVEWKMEKDGRIVTNGPYLPQVLNGIAFPVFTVIIGGCAILLGKRAVVGTTLSLMSFSQTFFTGIANLTVGFITQNWGYDATLHFLIIFSTAGCLLVVILQRMDKKFNNSRLDWFTAKRNKHQIRRKQLRQIDTEQSMFHSINDGDPLLRSKLVFASSVDRQVLTWWATSDRGSIL
ncbi:hypothetical protein BLNAU_15485 [Blattamonas nauphoetae]|uniref:Lysosomal dipeptide transporter MFSD1 n=1 Tax=Blattamonas nauphoetae TaxID=2049346 RepID=A0ABQ9XE18_9EUKA|nr:hypothetical protein BLNAU_15485 [Blattamonas nauphoetae]